VGHTTADWLKATGEGEKALVIPVLPDFSADEVVATYGQQIRLLTN
jgi:hypothetical protein